tara:strand:+ start:187 stop:372 length:186 start_codon:yes stop_codon:yes gene_type:complete
MMGSDVREADALQYPSILTKAADQVGNGGEAPKVASNPLTLIGKFIDLRQLNSWLYPRDGY